MFDFKMWLSLRMMKYVCCLKSIQTSRILQGLINLLYLILDLHKSENNLVYIGILIQNK